MRRAPGSEAVRARPKVLLVYRLQHHGDRSLRHLVLEGRNAERPLRAVHLGDVRPAHRRCLVAAGFDAIEEVHKVDLQVRLVCGRRHTVDAGRAVLAGQLVRLLHPFQVDDVVQRGQHLSRLAPRQFGYPSPFRGQVCRAHVPSHVSRRWLSPRDAFLPSFGSRRARFPALGGTMKALRLPIRVSMAAYWFASTAHGYLLVRVRRSAPGRSEVLFQAGALGQPVPDLSGSLFAGWESNPLDRCEWFQLVLTIIRPSCSPDATNLRSLFCSLPLALYLILHFPFLSLGASRRMFFVSTPETRGWGAPTGASDACEAPGFACHDRHAGASTEAPRVPSYGTLASRRSTVAIFGPGPCSPLSGIPSGIVPRPCSPHGSSLPEGAGLAGLLRRGSKPRRGRHASLRLSGSPHEAPLDERG